MIQQHSLAYRLVEYSGNAYAGRHVANFTVDFRSQQDERYAYPVSPCLLHQIQPGFTRHSKIGDHQIEVRSTESVQYILSAFNRRDMHLLAFENRLHCQSRFTVIVNRENPRLQGCSSARHWRPNGLPCRKTKIRFGPEQIVQLSNIADSGQRTYEREGLGT